MRNVSLVILLSAILIAITGCHSDTLYEKNIPVNCHGWDMSDSVSYQIDIQDLDQKYDLAINVRHRDIYEFMNLYLQITTVMPNGETKKDVVSLPLCDETGKWLGKCSGDLCFQRITMLRKTKFTQKGIYKFYMNHEMRQEKLKNLLDLGLRLEKSKSKVYTEGE